MASSKVSSQKEQSRRQQYDEYVRRIRDQRASSVESEVDSLLLVLELEKRPSLWLTRAVSFEEVVRKDRLVTSVTRWRAFKAARGFIPRKHLKSLGVPASCLIAVQPKRKQLRLLRKAIDFRRDNGVEPTYQYITRLLPKRAPAGPNRKALLRYIDILKDTIRELGGRVPPMEDS